MVPTNLYRSVSFLLFLALLCFSACKKENAAPLKKMKATVVFSSGDSILVQGEGVNVDLARGNSNHIEATVTNNAGDLLTVVKGSGSSVCVVFFALPPNNIHNYQS